MAIVTIGSFWIDNKNGNVVKVTKIKNGTVSVYDITKRRQRQRPIDLSWFGKTTNKGFTRVINYKG